MPANIILGFHPNLKIPVGPHNSFQRDVQDSLLLVEGTAGG